MIRESQLLLGIAFWHIYGDEKEQLHQEIQRMMRGNHKKVDQTRNRSHYLPHAQVGSWSLGQGSSKSEEVLVAQASRITRAISSAMLQVLISFNLGTYLFPGQRHERFLVLLVKGA